MEPEQKEKNWDGGGGATHQDRNQFGGEETQNPESDLPISGWADEFEMRWSVDDCLEHSIRWK